MTDVFKIVVKYRPEIIAKYRYLLPSGKRAQGGYSNIKFYERIL